MLMKRHGPEEPEDQADEPLPSRARAAMTLLLVLLLVLGGLVLVRVLRNMATIQDCAMSGRTNCVQIFPSGQ
jgi:hypothetical protein